MNLIQYKRIYFAYCRYIKKSKMIFKLIGVKF